MIVFFAVLASAAISFGLSVTLLPILRRIALSKPGARSSHRQPTPQGGGVGVIAATGFVTFAAIAAPGSATDHGTSIGIALLSALMLAIIGGIDDVRPIPVLPRLVMQTLAVGLLAGAVLRAAPFGMMGWPYGVQLVLATLVILWFVNLTNFMDGLDWLTVASFVPATATLAILGFAGVLSAVDAVLAAALCGGLIGFAPLNRPVARLFLGDVGSLPVGLLAAYLLIRLAAEGHVAAAILIPAYSCTDATLTLLRRALRREKIWRAHRSHFYQRATDNGFSVLEVSAHVFGLAVLQSALAIMTVVWSSAAVQGAALAVGAFAVGAVLLRFSRPRKRLSA